MGRHRYPEIGELVATAMRENHLGNKGLAAAAYLLGQDYGYDFRLGPSALETHIASVKQGYIWAGGSPNTKKAARKIERLAWLMLTLRIPKEHPLIQQLRENEDTRLTYPPIQGETLAGLL